ncbi:MAG: response regulator [Saprospiraceae bacterium]|jgi:DNA-binding LytR/AlgR family response regulator|nr:response regulator [Saprospiraceae bacterium]MCA0334085.1 response regulator [Bacteroidota bacterium]MCB0604303.1 response regulator [Saprospiraceae bacterium]HQW95799.1 response regulator [Saprospiraceae bacterium]HRG42837.1 response regulator [Saprospiraceae bacterium]
MHSPARILIVEDEMIIAANLSLQLTNLGYEVCGIIPRGEEALLHIRENPPDIILMDIQLKGEMDGIEVIRSMQREVNIPVIYLTANADDAHFSRAKETHPYAFISKPFKKLDLQRAIELTISQSESSNQLEKPQVVDGQSSYVLNEYLFVRNNNKLVKVDIKEIRYIEAERNYCRIYANDKEYLLVMTLKEMDEKLPQNHFIRVHRSFIVNIARIDEIATTHIVIGKTAIPITKVLKDELMKRIQTI